METALDLKKALQEDRSSVRKHDAAVARREDTGDLFVIINGEANEWDQNGTLVVKNDGIAVREPQDDPNASGQIIALVNGADGLPIFIEDIVRDGHVWLVFANDAFNLCDVVDLR